MYVKSKRPFFVSVFTVVTLIGLRPESASAQTLTDTWVTDGRITTVAPVGNIAYVGGTFTSIGPRTGGLVSFNGTDGTRLPTQLPEIGGWIHAMVPDGSGGYFVAGNYIGIGTTETYHLNHILPNGTLDPNWNPNPGFTVHGLALSGSTLYACGEFRHIGGQVRNGIAAIDVTTGLATPWNPNFGPIEGGTGCYTVAVVGSTVFAGGPIRHVGGATRNGFVALDATTGAVKFPTLTVDVNGFVNDMQVVGTTVYLGGEFQTLGGQQRQGVAAINGIDGTVLPFNPNTPMDPAGYRDKVFAIDVVGSTMYVGGLFNTQLESQAPTPTFGGQNRRNLAAVDMGANGGVGAVTSWDPGADGVVRAIATVGSSVYLGGTFRNAGGQPRNRLAAVGTNGTLLPWNPNANDAGWTFLVSGTTLHVGGHFASLGGVPRNNLAAIDLTTGQATSWAPPMACVNPCASGTILELLASGSTLYVRGAFSSIGGQTRANLAALDVATGNANAWAPVVDGLSFNSGYNLVDLEISGSTVYIAGLFTGMNGVSRPRLAAVDAGGTGGTQSNFNALLTTNDEVRVLDVGNGVLYVGGGFTNIGGAPRNRIAAVSLSTGAATAWNPNSDGLITALSVGGNTVYVGGDFNNIGGQPRRYLAGIDVTTGMATSLNVRPAFRVDTAVFFNNILYIRGIFRAVGSYPRHHIAAIDTLTGNVTAWNARINPNHMVYNMDVAIVAPQGLMCVVGDFLVALDRAQRSFAAMTLSGTAAGPRILNEYADPQATPIINQQTKIGTPTPAIPFRVGDDDTPASALMLTGSSSYKALVPDANIVFGGTNEHRTVTVTPAPGLSGVATIRVTVSDSMHSVHTDFNVFVEGAATANTPPTILSIPNQQTMPGVAKAVSFTIGDAETSPSSLTLSAFSSNVALVPNGTTNMVISGTGANRTITVTPLAGQTGTTNIDVIVADAGNLTTKATFTLTVGTVTNTPPTISAIANQSTAPGVAKGPLAFMVGDAETAVASLQVRGSSANQTLVPNANIHFGGSGASRTVTVTPVGTQTGSAVITVTVTDGGGLTANTTFTLSVGSTGNTAPTISDIPDQQTPVDAAKGPLAFTVGDAETAAGSLTLSKTSSNTTLVPVANIVFGGSGASRTVTISPAGGAPSGNTTITITVSDGSLTASDTFVLLVKTISLSGPFYMSEGRTGPFFDLYIALANPNTVTAPVKLTFLPEGGAPVAGTIDLPPMSRRTIKVDDQTGVEDAALSTVVESLNALPVVAERTMFWHESSYYAGHGEKAGSGGDRNWLFAEGSQGFFDTFLLLANPNPTETVATIQFLTEGAGVVTDTVTVAPNSRRTIHTFSYPALRNASFGITVTFSQPAVAERAMYFGAARFWDGGHSSAGVNAPATRWFHAEGATGGYFDTFILVANPNNAVANVVFTYFLPSGQVIAKNKQIAANSRLTVHVDSDDPALANTAVSTQVTSDMPVVSERSMYWAGPFTGWFEAHNSFGATTLTTKWGFAEGAVGGTLRYETYFLVTNPNAAPMDVTVTYLRFAGAPIVRTYRVNATSRFNVHVNGLVPELQDEVFAAIVEGPEPFAVERAMYWNALGVVWAGGTNATGTPLR